MFSKLLTILACIGVNVVFGQSIVFEQVALDYFSDSIINKQDPFKDLVIHFSGEVDSSITTLEYKMIMLSPNDSSLIKAYKKMELEMRTDEFWRKNKKPSFFLELKSSIKAIKKGKYEKKSNAIRLIVYQNINVGEKNYVSIRGFTRSGYTGHDIYFIMNSNGEVVKWYSYNFIF